MISALYVQARCAQLGLLLSDNALFNLGVVVRSDGDAKRTGSVTFATDTRLWYTWLTQNLSCVVILDTGSRELLDPGTITKGEMNTRAMRKWWDKLRWLGKQPSDWEEAKHLWSDMGSIDSLVECLRARHYCCVAKPLLTEPAVEEMCFIGAPFVRVLLREHEDDEILQWYLDNYLFGKLSSIYVSPNGISKLIEKEEPQAPYIRLEILLQIARYHQAKYIEQEDEILTNDQYKKLHHSW